MTDFTHSTRRGLLGQMGAGAAAIALAAGWSTQLSAKNFKVAYSDAEWRRRLGRDRYHILREEGTERAGTSALNSEKRSGIFTCAGCSNQLFSSATKYESGTGWPSFWRPLGGAVGTSIDRKLGYPRTEVHCADCGGHLGHVFRDGPEPTGLRYCMNGLAMQFQPG